MQASNAIATVESLAPDGCGIVQLDGKPLCIRGALPGEQVRFGLIKRRRKPVAGQLHEVLKASADRVEPGCAHFGVCGGCSLQHMSAEAQVHAKQQWLLEDLRQIGGVTPEEVLSPLTGPQWGYRRKARLSVKFVAKKGKALVGFRERHGPYVAELDRCEVVEPSVGHRLRELGSLIGSLSVFQRVPQVEVAIGDERRALVFRVLDAPSPEDRDRLMRFGADQGFDIYLQPAGPDSIAPLTGLPEPLSYALPEHDVRVWFLPTDFTQVNAEINRKIVDRVLELLDLRDDDRVLDLFCGLGNFTLPIARRAREVIGVEGEAGLVQRARDNASENGVRNASFFTANLAGEITGEAWANSSYGKVLLDPPRAGAQAVLGQLSRWGVERLVYVSCNPATLARDAGILVKEHGYQLVRAGVMDMFPHTTHVESIALFRR